jgi:MFS family permease
MIMGIATFLIGLLPTYDQIGVWAPILLLTLRLVQGIALGGEWGGAVVMSYEFAKPEEPPITHPSRRSGWPSVFASAPPW